MRIRLAVLGAVGFVVACSDDPGVLVHGIVSGQNQKVVAATNAKLLDGVTWRLARSSNGTITAQRIDKALDLLVPRAYAQGTVVTGSPVPGAVVCADESDGLKAFVICTNTDANGQATFFFEPTDPTRAQCVKSEIRGTLNDRPAVFDTAHACVVAGPANPNLVQNWNSMNSPALLSEFAVSDAHGNAKPYRIVSDGAITVMGDSVGTGPARTVTFGAVRLDSTGVLELRGQADTLMGRAYYSFVISNDKPAIVFAVRGLNAGAP